MKKSILILFLIVSNFTFSQNGKIYPKNSEIKHGEENTYIYESPKDLLLPENVKVSYIYPYENKSCPLVKNGNNYEFSIKVPDSIHVLILSINDKKNSTIDNNNDKGYVVILKNKTTEEIEKATLSKLEISQFANYFLKLNITPEEIVAGFDTLYSQNSSLKTGNSYLSYLYMKYKSNKEKAKPEMITYAKKLINNGDDKSLTSAVNLYSRLKMSAESEKVKKNAINKFPKGQLAKNDFLSEFYSKKDKTEGYILDNLKTYSIKFNDTTKKSKDQFYSQLINLSLKNKDTESLSKYENLLSDKLRITNMYNNHAWKLSGQNLTSPGEDLEYAEKISKKSLDIIKNRIENPLKNDDNDQLQSMYNMFADTYALILFKQKKYDLAYKYQNEIRLQDELGIEGKERYAVFAEKIKGSEYAKKYLEEELINGTDSKVMLNQLQEIYKKLSLPENKFQKIKEASTKLAIQKAEAKILKKYGNLKAIDFTLTNLKGENVKLSDFKGKVVILDFWATWCGPCKASFPGMQKLVDKYKGENVEFFFIDVWEKGETNKVFKNVTKFITENKYTFNVLFDYTDDIVNKYKINAIPTKIIIDKNGNIISINSSHENLITLIDENL